MSGTVPSRRLARSVGAAHVLVLGAIGIVAALAGTVATWNRGPEFGPKWYPILLVMTALPCVWAGGALVSARRKTMN